MTRSSPRIGVVLLTLPRHLLHHRIDPINHFVDAGPNSWVIFRCATAAPRRGTMNSPLPRLVFAHQGTTAVTLASIDDGAKPTTAAALCAQHGLVDLAAAIAAAISVRPGLHDPLL